jgi:hypothetical protein
MHGVLQRNDGTAEIMGMKRCNVHPRLKETALAEVDCGSGQHKHSRARAKQTEKVPPHINWFREGGGFGTPRTFRCAVPLHPLHSTRVPLTLDNNVVDSTDNESERTGICRVGVVLWKSVSEDSEREGTRGDWA